MPGEPPELRRQDGEPVFGEHAAGRYTSQSVLDAERRLLEAARTPADGAIAALAVPAALDGYEAVTGTSLDAGQRRLVPLATSAASADVLGRELSLPAENLHKFLHEWTSGPAAARPRAGAPVPGAMRPFALHPKDVVLVDEAGMAGADPAWGAVVRRLYDAGNNGRDPARLLETAGGIRELDSAESIAEVLTWRIDAILSDRSRRTLPTRPA